MTFRIEALAAEDFAHFTNMTDTELARAGACRKVVSECPGTPCRVSLVDAPVGETVLLVNYTHQAQRTPYRASHAIFARPGVAQTHPDVGEVPQVLSSRLMSVRGFDADHMMTRAEVVGGGNLDDAIRDFFADPRIGYIHLHNAKPGCYAAKVLRA